MEDFLINAHNKSVTAQDKMEIDNKKYSKNQLKFIKTVKKAGLKLYLDYSGRGMFGSTCPAVEVDSLNDFPGNPHKYQIDNMGMGFVIYAQY
jgi:hypothetical protein